MSSFYCGRCGAGVWENATQCPHCGTYFSGKGQGSEEYRRELRTGYRRRQVERFKEFFAEYGKRIGIGVSIALFGGLLIFALIHYAIARTIIWWLLALSGIFLVIALIIKRIFSSTYVRGPWGRLYAKNPRDYIRTRALIKAVGKGKLERVKDLLDLMPDNDRAQSYLAITCMIYAAETRQYAVLEELLKKWYFMIWDPLIRSGADRLFPRYKDYSVEKFLRERVDGSFSKIIDEAVRKDTEDWSR